jgi:hypothetical protein
MNLYIGFDQREALGTHVFLASLIKYSSAPIPVTILNKGTLERNRSTVSEGTNAFTMSRFLVPYFQGFRGWAVFMDGADMLMRDDICKIFDLIHLHSAVQVVHHSYDTRHKRKYVGTSMEADNEMYPRKNWASVMLMNCSHYAWRKITPEYINSVDKMHMLQFRFMDDKYLSSLPREWNWLADEYGESDSAKVLHWTAGVPGFPHYRNAPHAREWLEAVKDVNNVTN